MWAKLAAFLKKHGRQIISKLRQLFKRNRTSGQEGGRGALPAMFTVLPAVLPMLLPVAIIGIVILVAAMVVILPVLAAILSISSILDNASPRGSMISRYWNTYRIECPIENPTQRQQVQFLLNYDDFVDEANFRFDVETMNLILEMADEDEYQRIGTIRAEVEYRNTHGEYVTCSTNEDRLYDTYVPVYVDLNGSGLSWARLYAICAGLTNSRHISEEDLAAIVEHLREEDIETEFSMSSSSSQLYHMTMLRAYAQRSGYELVTRGPFHLNDDVFQPRGEDYIVINGVRVSNLTYRQQCLVVPLNMDVWCGELDDGRVTYSPDTIDDMADELGYSFDVERCLSEALSISYEDAHIMSLAVSDGTVRAAFGDRLDFIRNLLPDSVIDVLLDALGLTDGEYNLNNSTILETDPNCPYVSDQFIWPAPGIYRITSSFGRRTPGGVVTANHYGTDIGCPMRTAIVAAADGTVIISRWSNSAGNWIIIDHGNSVYTVYMHGDERIVQEGEHVTAGQQIMWSGTTGASTGPHLHFEIRIGGWNSGANYSVDPMTIFHER